MVDWLTENVLLSNGFGNNGHHPQIREHKRGLCSGSVMEARSPYNE